MTNVIYDMSEDTRIREIARLREKAMHDEASALKHAKAEGIEEGMTKGMAKGVTQGAAKEREATIRMLKANGFSDEQISAMYAGRK